MTKKNIPRTLKGFRDFLPEQMYVRQYVLSVIRKTFELYGFEPLETPALEYASTLLGKYGEEADRLVYSFNDKGGRKVALKYDQTVPTARVIAKYKNSLHLPWRRFQIQPAWRAEKPQRGRFREFLQCDIDIFGTTSSLADAEIIATAGSTLANLGLSSYSILINDRKVLFEIMKKIGVRTNDQLSVIQTLDKLDKKSKKEVFSELESKGLAETKIDSLFGELEMIRPTKRLQTVIDQTQSLGIPSKKIQFSPTLARGLDYYTSTIFEFKIDGYTAGSVGGGGRYDNLIGRLSGEETTAVGMAFGFDRVVETVEKLSPSQTITPSTQVLVTIFDKKSLESSLKATQQLRENGVSTELYTDTSAKLNRQLKYANKKGISYVIIIGPEERNQNKVLLKNMRSGKQESLTIDALISKLKKT